MARFAQVVFVVDSGSTDDTVAIAEANGARVLHHPWRNYAEQFQWALENVGTEAEWVMRLDADEVIEADLAARIAGELPGLPADVVGVSLDRRHIFMGRWIRHGGRYPLRLLRIFRRGHGRIEQRWMDEHIIVEGGRTVHFDGGFADHNLNDLSYFIAKHNSYATREAIDVLNQRLGLFGGDAALGAGSGSRQAERKRWIKEQVYNRLPFTLASLGYFLWRYVGQLGFLDGREGLVYHLLQGFWYRFLVGAKLLELERGIAGLTDKAAILARTRGVDGIEAKLTRRRATAPGGPAPLAQKPRASCAALKAAATTA